MNPYSYQVRTSLIKLHDLSHQYYPTPETPIDNSCQICYPKPDTGKLTTAFLTFWTLTPILEKLLHFFKFKNCLFEGK